MGIADKGQFQGDIEAHGSACTLAMSVPGYAWIEYKVAKEIYLLFSTASFNGMTAQD
ncbi:MAG: hypothetical protein KJ725_01165 [Gammaproteobacteria bacterium]|nr:hypothetical protein [Gammaproteobacteria bacterium]